MSVGESLRLFVAADVPEDLRRACARLREVEGRALKDARWVGPEGLHLTFAFLGDRSADELGSLSEAVRHGAREAEPFDLRTKGVGVFGSPSRPRVLWVGFEGDGVAATHLAASLAHALSPLGYVPQGRAFRPHLTLARFRPERRVSIAREFLRAASERMSGFVIAVTGISLYRSELLPGGARHTPFARAPLGLS